MSIKVHFYCIFLTRKQPLHAVFACRGCYINIFKFYYSMIKLPHNRVRQLYQYYLFVRQGERRDVGYVYLRSVVEYKPPPYRVDPPHPARAGDVCAALLFFVGHEVSCLHLRALAYARKQFRKSRVEFGKLRPARDGRRSSGAFRLSRRHTPLARRTAQTARRGREPTCAGALPTDGAAY